MRNLVPGEWMKAWTGRTWLVLASAGIFMSLITCFGYASQGDGDIALGTTTASAVTDDMVQAWMMTFLMSAVFGALLVTREYSSGAIARSVLLSGGRLRLLSAKALVATAVGVLGGLLAVALAALCAFLLPARFGFSADWTGHTTRIALGVLTVNALAAPWGALLGWIIRSQLATVVTVMALTLLVEPGLQELAPQVAKYLPTIAMSSVYLDGKPELLSVPLALLVLAGWLAAAGTAARRLLLSRDVI
ncbi:MULTISPECIES: ABC transporter permease [unclassified Streptomyces]|uniref:ABC transporter permease n=1 Tax=unclassified Streptomyces TaxID=2593676 RepID=UPI002E333320|nr:MULTISPECIES: ABC transporter permease [unclassified Streptomyces]WUC65730.1 ABC transporter permease [Streptomyces sp. NBC_00539]